MFFSCQCGKWWKAHDSSNSLYPGLCTACKQESIRKLGLRKAPRTPVRAFSEDNPRSRYTNKAWVEKMFSQLKAS